MSPASWPLNSPEKCWQALWTAYVKLDRGIDAIFPAIPLGIIPHSLFLILAFCSLYLDWRFEENTIPNFYEYPIFDDYDELMEKGIIQYLGKTHLSFDELLRFQTVLPVSQAV